MGKYNKAIEEINAIESKKNEQIKAINESIKSLKNKISLQEEQKKWRDFRAKLLLDEGQLGTIHTALIIADILGFIICLVALIAFDKVQIDSVMSYVFIKRFYKAKAFRKAFWSVLSLTFLIDFINNVINIIFDISGLLLSAYRHIQRVIFAIANLIVVNIAMGKFRESMWSMQYHNLQARFNMAFHTHKDTRVVMALLLIIGAINVAILIYHLGSFIYAIIHDAIALNNAKKSDKNQSATKQKIQDKQAEIAEIKKKYNEDIDIANQLAEAIRTQGEAYFVEAMQSDPYDNELLQKAIDYDNPQACYLYVRDYLNKEENNSHLTDKKRQKLLEKMLPYIEIASNAGIPSAKFLEIRTIVGRPESTFQMNEFNNFIATLEEAMATEDFEYAQTCADLIKDIKTARAELQSKNERMKEIQRHKEQQEKQRLTELENAESNQVTIELDARGMKNSISYEVRMDGKMIATINGGDFKKVKVAPGHHKFTCSAYNYGNFQENLPPIEGFYGAGTAHEFTFNQTTNFY